LILEQGGFHKTPPLHSAQEFTPTLASQQPPPQSTPFFPNPTTSTILTIVFFAAGKEVQEAAL
jgi:hypothetical protein